MFKAILFVVTGLIASAVFSNLSSHAVATLVDFEDGTGQDVVIPNNNYPGLTFDNAVWISIGSQFHDGVYGLGVDAGIVGFNNWAFPGTSSPIVIEFDAPVSGVSIDAFDVGDRGAQLEAFNSSGSSVGSDSFTSGGSQQLDVTLSVSSSDIVKITLSQLVNVTSNGDGVAWDNLSYSALIAGDFDGNGRFDALDFLTWQRNPSIGDLADWEQNFVGSPELEGDYDGNGGVNALDFLLWQRIPGLGDLPTWEATYGLLQNANTAAVPEPGSLILVLAGVCFGLSRRPR